MKKLFSLVIALGLLFTGSTFGQDATVSIPDIVYKSGTIEIPGTIEVPVEVDFTLKDVCTFQFSIYFNDDYLNFEGIKNKAIPDDDGSWIYDAPGSQSPILITWFTNNQDNPADFEGELLLLEFEFLGGNSEIGFDLANSAVGDCADAVDYQDVIFNNGSVNLAPPIPLSNWAVVAGLALILAFVIIRLGKFF